jgi:hypothetical protein
MSVQTEAESLVYRSKERRIRVQCDRDGNVLGLTVVVTADELTALGVDTRTATDVTFYVEDGQARFIG